MTLEDMHYTEFRAKVYELIDKALRLSTDPLCDSVHIDMEDDIDEFMTLLKGGWG